MENELLRELIPTDRSSQWSKDKLVLKNGSKIYLSSYSENVRGSHVDYIFGDEVATYTDRHDNYKIWFRDVLSRITSKKGTVAAVSTPIEPGDLITLLMNKKGWFSKSYPVLVDKDGNPAKPPYTKETAIPIWPERHTFEDLMRILDEQGEENFERNFMCNPKSAVTQAVFDLRKFSLCLDKELTFTKKVSDGLVFIGADFALTDHPDSDFDAFVVVEKTKDLIYVRHIETHKGISVDEKINRLIELGRIYNPYQIICDESNVGGYIVQRLQQNGFPAVGQPFGAKSRNRLLSTLQIIIGNKKLIVPYNKEDFNTVKLVDELTYQLSGFKEEKSLKTGMTVYVSKSDHDDIVMALALAVSGAEEQDIGIAGFGSVSQNEIINVAGLKRD